MAATIDIPQMYNATNHFIDRHAGKTSGARVAYTDHTGDWTYQELAAMVNQAGHVLSNLGLKAEQRMLMCMTDSVWFPAVFWGAIKIGAVPVPVNTMLTDADYAYMLNDSCARVLVVSESLYPKFVPHIDAQSSLGEVVIDGSGTDGRPSLSVLMESFEAELPTAPTKRGDAAFWLYTSGSTGQPKGVVHRHSDLVQTARLYGDGILKLDKSDVAFSAAKLFFAYGLGNGMSFPLHVGCRTVLLADRPTPESVLSVMKDQDVSIFFGVPTLYGAILSDNANDRSKVSEQLRLCVSAGEALPEEIGKEWERRFGVPILDGLGSTELLHIFLSNRPDDVRYGTTGRPVSGYKLRIVDEDDMDVSAGEMGELLVSGPSSAVCYWGQPEKSAQTFQGEWTRSGDKYYKDQQDYYVYCGRTDDMLKVGGIWVSPFEVESALIADERVLEVAVIGYKDDHGLVKPKAYVVLKAGVEKTSELVEELQGFVKDRLAPFKYPRRIDFIDALPKTATGKIQRYKLRHRHTDQP